MAEKVEKVEKVEKAEGKRVVNRITAKKWAEAMGPDYIRALEAKGAEFSDRVEVALRAKRDADEFAARVTRLEGELKQAQVNRDEARAAAKEIDACVAEIKKVVDALK